MFRMIDHQKKMRIIVQHIHVQLTLWSFASWAQCSSSKNPTVCEIKQVVNIIKVHPLSIGCPHFGGRLFCFASPGSLTSLTSMQINIDTKLKRITSWILCTYHSCLATFVHGFIPSMLPSPACHSVLPGPSLVSQWVKDSIEIVSFTLIILDETLPRGGVNIE
jgi:hypothetical protein